jgi:uncharacterized protein YjbI with pentapeptide repeats
MPIDPTTTNLEAKDYTGRDLRGANLAYHRVMRANFTGADLRGANFTGADCTGAIFTGAQLDGCDFTDAIIDGVIGSIGAELTGAQQPTIPLVPAPAESALALEYMAMRGKIERLEDDNALLRQQLDDALAEIKRLTQGVPDENEQERQPRRRKVSHENDH